MWEGCFGQGGGLQKVGQGCRWGLGFSLLWGVGPACLVGVAEKTGWKTGWITGRISEAKQVGMEGWDKVFG